MSDGKKRINPDAGQQFVVIVSGGLYKGIYGPFDYSNCAEVFCRDMSKEWHAPSYLFTIEYLNAVP